MSKKDNKILSALQKLGKSLMLPIAVLPAASILNRIGAPDLLNILWLQAAGAAIFDNLPIIFAIGIAIGLAKSNHGAAGLSASIGYLVLDRVAVSFAMQLYPNNFVSSSDKIEQAVSPQVFEEISKFIPKDSFHLQMGVLAGIIAGITAGYLYNRFYNIKLPDFLGFFGGKRFVPIITSFACTLIGLIFGGLWPLIQDGIDSFGNKIVSLGTVGAGVFGIINRLLIPFGLHHVLNTICWFQFGTYEANGQVFTGDITRFLNGDPSAGIFQTGFFPIMMFALPAACIAMILAAKKHRRKATAGALISIALTAFLTGITEPIEFSFMFLAPVLYAFHAVMTGISLAVSWGLGIHHGFGFSAGAFDYILNFGLAQKPLLLILIGLVFAAIYFVVFYFAIKKFNLPTPGNEEEDDNDLPDDDNVDYQEQSVKYLKALGGAENIEVLDNCITRLRITLKDDSIVKDSDLKAIGAMGVIRLGKNNIQIIVGTKADAIVEGMRKSLGIKD